MVGAEAIVAVEDGATTTGVEEGRTSELGVDDEEAEATTTTVDWLAEVVSDMVEDAGGVEEEGGAVPVITTVAA